ncbi:MAG: hypothetical protein EAY76_03075 [Alphaproteobacteria bacterium]|nr:MAG: hypothetical protein EAY76_03075 [Alphaproteobacteria bacterium]TAF76715.1 MAG: hypothetical protein EAZ52_02890 [Alphaproteobacteria bacterium]
MATYTNAQIVQALRSHMQRFLKEFLGCDEGDGHFVMTQKFQFVQGTSFALEVSGYYQYLNPNKRHPYALYAGKSPVLWLLQNLEEDGDVLSAGGLRGCARIHYTFLLKKDLSFEVSCNKHSSFQDLKRLNSLECVYPAPYSYTDLA